MMLADLIADRRLRSRLCPTGQQVVRAAACAGDRDGQRAGQAGAGVAGRGAQMVAAPQPLATRLQNF